MSDINFHLEALREIKGWSTWVVGISSAALALVAFRRSDANARNRRDTKAILIAASVAFIAAVTLLATIPYVIAELPNAPRQKYVIGSIAISGVYAYDVLGFMPLWILQLALHVSILVGAFFGLSIVWRSLFDSSFLDGPESLAIVIEVCAPVPTRFLSGRRRRLGRGVALKVSPPDDADNRLLQSTVFVSRTEHLERAAAILADGLRGWVSRVVVERSPWQPEADELLLMLRAKMGCECGKYHN